MADDTQGTAPVKRTRGPRKSTLAAIAAARSEGVKVGRELAEQEKREGRGGEIAGGLILMAASFILGVVLF